MASEVVNFAHKLSKFSTHWSPRVVAEMNDYQFKLVKLLVEPRRIVNTGRAGGPLTAPNDVWV